jgi:hypothetical protein
MYKVILSYCLWFTLRFNNLKWYWLFYLSLMINNAPSWASIVLAKTANTSNLSYLQLFTRNTCIRCHRTARILNCCQTGNTQLFCSLNQFYNFWFFGTELNVMYKMCMVFIVWLKQQQTFCHETVLLCFINVTEKKYANMINYDVNSIL